MQVCHKAMAEGCLRYLLHLSEKAPLAHEDVDEHPLARYAAENWWQHAQKINSTLGGVLFDLASRLLTNENAALLVWVQIYNVDRSWEGLYLSLKANDMAQPLYYAASVGVSELVGNIWRQTINVHAQGGCYGNALQAK